MARVYNSPPDSCKDHFLISIYMENGEGGICVVLMLHREPTTKGL